MFSEALAIGRGIEDTAPLGRAFIELLFAARLRRCFLLPTGCLASVQKIARIKSASLDPE